MVAVAVPKASPAPPVEGVTLEQYAGVSAAVIEGFPLPAALENDGLDAGAWPRVSLRWSQRLAADGAAGPLSTSYRATLAFARAWLGRKVAPLDDDLAAWLGFLNAFSAHAEPFDLLDDLGILPSDVARIQGAWAQRVEEDEELRKKALAIAKKKPSAVPKVTVTKAELRPFPWTKKRAAAAADVAVVKPKLSSSFIGDAFGLERYAALSAELGLAPKGGAAAVLAKQALDEAGFEALKARWERRFATDPTLGQDFKRLVRYYEAKVKAAAAKQGEAKPEVREAPRAAAKAALAGTSLALDVPRGPALPFVAGPAPDEIALAEAEIIFVEEEEAPAPRNALAGTSLALDVPRGPATPFERKAPPKLAGTSLAMEVPAGPALPFKESSGVFAAPAAAEKPAEERKAPSAKLGGTSLAVEVPQRAATPFEEAGAPGGGAKKNKLAAMSMDLRIEGAWKGGTPAKAEAPAPALTLEQHASLTVEIAMAPERAMEVLARYGLTAEGKRAVDAYWQRRVAGDAGVREAWQRAYGAYWEWVMKAGRR